MAGGPLNPQGLGPLGGFNARMGVDPLALRTVQGMAQQYAMQRGGRTVLRPVVLGRSRVTSVPFTAITYIDADNPGTNYYSETGPFAAYSTAHGSFSNKKRIVFKLRTPVAASLARHFMAVFNGFTALSLDAVDVYTALGSMTLAFRAVAITSDFDPETLIWTDWAGLTVINGGYTLVPASVAISGNLNPASQTITKAVDVQFTGGINDMPSLALHAAWLGTLYGVALEVAPFNSGSGSPSSIAATAIMQPSLDTNPTVFEGYRSGIIINPATA